MQPTVQFILFSRLNSKNSRRSASQKLLKKKNRQKFRQAQAALAQAEAEKHCDGDNFMEIDVSRKTKHCDGDNLMEQSCSNKTNHCDGDNFDGSRPSSSLIPKRRVKSKIVANIDGNDVTRDLQVVLDSTKKLAPPQAFRFEGHQRSQWFLPCCHGMNQIIIGDSQLKT